eukprot:TRINITY_DN35429_c0_g1_i1.p1 TRINITY_DN35429_c0_g1~~TRINITY_DN35429_c0_g1_i1.p1  ORF type:complete len:250 (+),score=46.31 TRINITY_DN35429_c0_g1_i1:49-750(+)
MPPDRAALAAVAADFASTGLTEEDVVAAAEYVRRAGAGETTESLLQDLSLLVGEGAERLLAAVRVEDSSDRLDAVSSMLSPSPSPRRCGAERDVTVQESPTHPRCGDLCVVSRARSGCSSASTASSPAPAGGQSRGGGEASVSRRRQSDASREVAPLRSSSRRPAPGTASPGSRGLSDHRPALEEHAPAKRRRVARNPDPFRDPLAGALLLARRLRDYSAAARLKCILSGGGR